MPKRFTLLVARLWGEGPGQSRGGDASERVQADALSGRQLAAQLGISAPAVVKLCDRLEARGYIERVRDDVDRHVQWFQLTRSGLAVFKRLVAVNRASMAPALKRLSPRDRVKLTRLLSELAAGLELARSV